MYLKRLVTASAATVLLGVSAFGCGASSDDGNRSSSAAGSGLEGAYRLSTTADELASSRAQGDSPESWGTWTLVLGNGRFAFTKENDRRCTWAYGSSKLTGKTLDWTVADSGGIPLGGIANQPGDRYRFQASLYRDVLRLRPVKGARAGYFVLKPWQRIAETQSADGLSRRCPPSKTALVPAAGAQVAPHPGPALFFGGNLTKTGPTTWEGNATSRRLGRGRLTVNGTVVFKPSAPRDRLTFVARFPPGELRGCANQQPLPRPYGRILWGGLGHITATSPALRRYLGIPGSLAGVAKADDLTHLHGSFDSTRGVGGPC